MNGRMGMKAKREATALSFAAPRPLLVEGETKRRGGVAQLETLLDSETAALAVLDVSGRISRANRGFAALPGQGRAALIGVAPDALFVAEDRAGIAAAVARALSGEAALPIEARLDAMADDPDAAVELHCRPLRGEPGALLRLQDITEQRRLRSQLTAASRMQAIGQLAGGVAHDFNNLLATISVSAEAALARRPGGETEADLEQILDSAGRGARLVGQLLAFASAQPMQPRILELGDAILAAEPLLRRLVGGAVRIDLTLDRGVAPVRLDPTQLDQLLLNLAANARDAMEGGGRLRIALFGRTLSRPLSGAEGPVPEGAWVVLEVADQGCGMAPAVLRRVFEPFFTTRRGKGGTGLGLSTVLGVVRQSGGHLSIRSREGQGTSVRLWLPPADAAAAAEPPPAVVAQQPARSPGRRVLLVEDEAPLRRLALRALEAAGHSVVEAEDVEGAYAAIAAGMPDLVVTDVMLAGGGDGYVLARALRERYPALPIMLVSGYAEGAVGRDLGAEGLGFLAKPFRTADLVAAVARISAG